VSATASQRVRISARVEGTVQGVGFRPFVYRLARELGLDGFVLNDASGVLLEVEGDERAVETFLARLGGEPPPLAVLERVSVREREPTGERGFAIRESPRGESANAPITPDTATCADCLREMFDPADRRFRYPFINCTDCGPRFTIVRGVPYDRPLTTMSAFAMCELCQTEYEDPVDRRFHAQPNACPSCGPSVTLLDRAGRPAPVGDCTDAVQAAARALRDGKIVAVKGIGGYHLAARADDERVVAALRARKHREDKPFALMVADVGAARELVELGPEEETLLRSAQRPIVVASRRPAADVAPSVAPGAPELGVMLAYSPLHHLLVRDAAVPLVMTSGNVSDEPIAFRDEEAIERLAPIADLLLIHNRAIETRTDDSVIRVVNVAGGRRALPIRRSRGYVPGHLPLPIPARRPVLACGAEQKNTFCVARGWRAWVGHHIGDLEHFATHNAFREGVSHFETMFAVTPEIVAHDLHPGYLSTAYALERAGVDHVGIQHHHAHLAACLAEHGVTAPALGAIFDGTGYGTDGTVWGGELLIGDLSEFTRAGRLRGVTLPGGSAAVREPWRMASRWLAEAFGEPQPLPAQLAGSVEPRAWEAMARIAAAPELSPVTTSMGRLFDAVAALCGVRASVSYEGQAAIELEALAATATDAAGYEIELDDDGAGLVLDPRPAVRAIARDAAAADDIAGVAAGFHAALARATTEACLRIASSAGLDTVVLSGGVFQNRLLLEQSARELARTGLRVLTPVALPPNDGGVSFGQAAIAAAREARAG
jgi:hydrogenase maturation protein HypF